MSDIKMAIEASTGTIYSHQKKINQLLRAGDYSNIELYCKQLIANNITDYLIYDWLSIACGMQGRHDEMLKYCQHSLKLKYDYPPTHNNAGYALQRLNQLDLAILAYKKAIELKDDYVDAYINLGEALILKRDYHNASMACKKAVKISPNEPKALNNLATAQLYIGDIKSSIELYQATLNLKQSNEYYVNLAIVQLLSGDYENGWQNYEKRVKSDGSHLWHGRTYNCKPVEIKNHSKNKQILIVSEQGLGDTLQFMRYVNNLRNLGWNCRFSAPEKLHDLIKSSDIDQSPLTLENSGHMKQRQWISLMSLPKYLNVTPEAPRNNLIYIKTTKKAEAEWKKKIFTKLPKRKLLIGLNWQGNRPDASKAGRNVPLTELLPAIQNQKVCIVSIQRGCLHAKELKQLRLHGIFDSEQEHIRNLANSDKPEDFLNYAGFIKCCDLIITSATTTAHLAAGMGKPTWILLEKIPDWRWGLEGDSTFWYPSAKLFRQSQHGDWGDVITQVSSQLEELLKRHISDNSGE